MAEQRLERKRPQPMAVQPASGISNTERQRQRERKERRGKMKIWQEGESRQRQQCKNNHQQGQYQNWKGGNGDNRKGKQAKFSDKKQNKGVVFKYLLGAAQLT